MSIKDQIPVDHKCWYAVKCKFRCEKRLVRDLQDQDIEAYVPIQKKLKQYASRKKKSECALIPSHVFVKIDRSEYIKVLQHIHVYSFLHFSGSLSAIRQSDMDIMKRVVGEIDDIGLQDSTYTPGDEIQIIGGELTGLKGYLVESNNHNFIITLESLGMGLKIKVDSKYLTKLRSTRKVA